MNTSTEGNVGFLVVLTFRVPSTSIGEVLGVVVREERRGGDDVTFGNGVFSTSDGLHNLAHEHDEGRVTADGFTGAFFSKVHFLHDLVVGQVVREVSINVGFLELVEPLLVVGLHEVEEGPGGGDGRGVLASEHGSDNHTTDFMESHVRTVRVASIHETVQQIRCVSINVTLFFAFLAAFNDLGETVNEFVTSEVAFVGGGEGNVAKGRNEDSGGDERGFHLGEEFREAVGVELLAEIVTEEALASSVDDEGRHFGEEVDFTRVTLPAGSDELADFSLDGGAEVGELGGGEFTRQQVELFAHLLVRSTISDTFTEDGDHEGVDFTG